MQTTIPPPRPPPGGVGARARVAGERMGPRAAHLGQRRGGGAHHPALAVHLARPHVSRCARARAR
eukprot:7891939-Alexandrium_andersonii.AAC.1